MSEKTKKCKYCKAEINKDSKFCTKCGKKQGGDAKIVAVIVAFVLIFNLVLSIGFGDSEEKNNEPQNEQTENVVSEIEEETEKEKKEPTEAEYKAACMEYNYKDVLRNPENYVGEKIKITVKISSVHEKSWSNSTKYYFGYSNDEYDWWLGDMYGIFDMRESQDLKLLEDDIIAVYGEISDPEHTTSIIVQSEEVFCINMKYVELIAE